MAKVAKKSSPKKAKTATAGYTGTLKVYNAGVEAKNPARVAAAKKAKATLRAKAAAKVKKATKSKKGVKKAGAKKVKTGVKRAPTAFFIFSADHRAEIKKKHPNFKVTEIASELGKQWRGLSAEKKKPYEAKAAAAKKKLGQ